MNEQMEESFGEILRRLRIEAKVGLRELALLLKKSPGYLSDIEHDRVLPSESVIVEIANILQADRQILLTSAKKVDPELSSYVLKEPQAADFLRFARDREFTEADWDKLNQLAEIAELGKKGGGK